MLKMYRSNPLADSYTKSTIRISKEKMDQLMAALNEFIWFLKGLSTHKRGVKRHLLGFTKTYPWYRTQQLAHIPNWSIAQNINSLEEMKDRPKYK